MKVNDAVTLNDDDIEIYHSLVSKTQFFII